MAFKRIENLTDPILADPKRRANVERERREAVGEIIAHSLAELRRAREVTQVEVARTSTSSRRPTATATGSWGTQVPCSPRVTRSGAAAP